MQKQTRLALRRPVRVEAGERLGVYLHTPDSYGSGVGYHHGYDASPVQGDGLVIHKGTYTNSATPFEDIYSHDRFFGGSVEYELLPAAAAAAPAGETPRPPLVRERVASRFWLPASSTPLPRTRAPPKAVSGKQLAVSG
jgi:hypothetical protein